MKKLQKNRKVMALVGASSVFTFYITQVVTSWPGLVSSGIRGQTDYIDQTLVLDFAKCFREFGNEIYKVNGIPEQCGGFQYSSFLLWLLNNTKISEVNGSVLGVIFMFLTLGFLSVVFFAIKDYGKLHFLLAFLACISPGVWLLLERGNYDEVIFCLVVTSGLLLTSKFRVIPIFLVALSALMKFYTIPALFFVIFMTKTMKARVIYFFISIPLVVFSVFMISKVESFPSTWNVSFGLPSFGLYVEFLVSRLLNRNFDIPDYFLSIPGLLLIIFLLILIKKFELKPSIRLKNQEKQQRYNNLYNLVLVVFMSCYFAGMNFDYRLIYLSVLVSITPAILHENRYRTLVTVSGLFALVFNSYLFGFHGLPALAIQMSGDIFLTIFVVTQLIYLLYYFPLKKLTSRLNIKSLR